MVAQATVVRPSAQRLTESGPVLLAAQIAAAEQTVPRLTLEQTLPRPVDADSGSRTGVVQSSTSYLSIERDTIVLSFVTNITINKVGLPINLAETLSPEQMARIGKVVAEFWRPLTRAVPIAKLGTVLNLFTSHGARHVLQHQAVDALDDLPEDLRNYVEESHARIKGWEGESFGASLVEQRHGISRQNLTYYRQNNLVIALPRGTRNFVYPDEQFRDGAVLPGIREVIAITGSPGTAWLFLVTHHPHLKGERPIDLIKIGKSKNVIGLAKESIYAIDTS